MEADNISEESQQRMCADICSRWISAFVQCSQDCVAVNTKLDSRDDIAVALESQLLSTLPLNSLRSAALHRLHFTEPESLLLQDESAAATDAKLHNFLFDCLKVDAGLQRELVHCAFYKDIIRKATLAAERCPLLNTMVREQESEIQALEARTEELEQGLLRSKTAAIKISDSSDKKDSVEIVEEVETATVAVAEDSPLYSPPAKALRLEDGGDGPLTPVACQMLSSESAGAPPYNLQRQVVLTQPVKLLSIDRFRLIVPKDIIENPIIGSTGQLVLAASANEQWMLGSIQQTLDPGPVYLVEFADPSKAKEKTKKLTGQQVACAESCEVRLEKYPVGTRVVAAYVDDVSEEADNCPSYYAGIVAESPNERNQFRYLVFYDDGCCQYVVHSRVWRIFEQSINNWQLAASDCQQFIREYLENFPNRSMLRVHPDERVLAELCGEWYTATVLQVDASLILLQFPERREWLYRGSTRLHRLYRQQQRQQLQQLPRRRTGGYQRGQVLEYSGCVRALARKSTTYEDPLMQDSSAARDEDDVVYRGTLVPTLESQQLPPVTPYQPHRCSIACVATFESPTALDALRGWNPLEKPLLLGWHRLLSCATEDGRRREFVEYLTPCSRRLRGYADLDMYLGQTASCLPVALFCFDPTIRLNAEFRPEKVIYQLKDISYGKERVPVTAVNSVDNSNLPYIDYATERVPINDLVTNEDDPGFLVCCDCTDDCRDKRRCTCQQLTIRASQAVTGRVDLRVTYKHGRLLQRAIGGVYECNTRCSCRVSACRNRVVQHGLQNRLQRQRPVSGDSAPAAGAAAMPAATRTARATRPIVRELRQWQFTRSLETVFDDLGDGRKYHNRSKSLAEARNLLDRWLLSFQMDYFDKMDEDFPIFPRKLSEKDSVNEKLMDECLEKHFSIDAHNAREIFGELCRRIESFKRKHRNASYDERLEVEYYEEEDEENAEIRVQDAKGDFKTQNCQRVRFLVRNFGLEASARMLMRYESLGTGSLQWGDPITVHNALYREMGVRYEGFASPLNSKMLGKKGAHFCSLFFDTDEEFGSLGNFFKVDFSQHPGGWTVNPPFIESLMEQVADKILRYVQEDDRSEQNVFFVTFPRWTDTPGWEMLDKCDRLLDKIDLFSGEFTVQCCYGRVFPPRNDLTVFVVGRELPPGASIDKIKRIFRDLDTEYIKQEWQKNCQIRMKVEESKIDKDLKQREKPKEKEEERTKAEEEAPTERIEVAPYVVERVLQRFKRKADRAGDKGCSSQEAPPAKRKMASSEQETESSADKGSQQTPSE